MRPTMTPEEILNDAADLLSKTDVWARGTYARTKAGKSVKTEAEDAECFCMVGALARVANVPIAHVEQGVFPGCIEPERSNSKPAHEAYNRLCKTIFYGTPEPERMLSTPTLWNDRQVRAKDVVAILRKAATT